MSSAMNKVACASVLGLLCVAFGMVSGGPQQIGPCMGDAGTTCATTCADVLDADNNFLYSQLSTDNTELPYCKNVEGFPKCDPRAAFKNCNFSKYPMTKCQGAATGITNSLPICK